MYAVWLLYPFIFSGLPPISGLPVVFIFIILIASWLEMFSCFFHLVLLFWYQIFTCCSDTPTTLANKWYFVIYRKRAIFLSKHGLCQTQTYMTILDNSKDHHDIATTAGNKSIDPCAINIIYNFQSLPFDIKTLQPFSRPTPPPPHLAKYVINV